MGGGRLVGSDAPMPPTMYVPRELFSAAHSGAFQRQFLKARPKQGRRPAPLAPPFSTSFRTDTSDFITLCSPRDRRAENAVQ